MHDDSEDQIAVVARLQGDLLQLAAKQERHARTLKTLLASTVVLSVCLVFYGYGLLESVRRDLFDWGKDRLAKTDSSITYISNRIGEFNREVEQSREGLNRISDTLRFLAARSSQLASALSSVYSLNKEKKYNPKPYDPKPIEDGVKVDGLISSYSANQRADFTLTFGKSIRLINVPCIWVRIWRGTNERDYKFEVKPNRNLISINLPSEKGKYMFEVGYVRKDGTRHFFYRAQREIEII